MRKLYLYYKREPERYRWIPGDQFPRQIIRSIVRGKSRPSGVDKVFINLSKGLDRLGISYTVNAPFREIGASDLVGVIGRGKYCLKGYNKENPLVAGVALMTHPSEWPTLCEEYPVAKYLQHSEWTNEIYKPYYGNRCDIWPVGIDTEEWNENTSVQKVDKILIYNKIQWNKEFWNNALCQKIKDYFSENNIQYTELVYGSYQPEEFKAQLQQVKAIVLLTAHESQGIAYQEALSCNVPILAWDQGRLLDPVYEVLGETHREVTSVPYWDERCGMKFNDTDEFEEVFPEFWEKARFGRFSPREYVLDYLTLEKSARQYLDKLEEVNS